MSEATTAARRGPVTRTRAVWNSRRTLWLLVRRDLKVRYADSLLGYVWSVLDPLVMSMIYWFVFTQIFERSVGQQPYIVFLLFALLPWLWFSSGLTEGTKALSSQARLVRSTSLPREIWVLRSVIAKGIEFGFAIPVLLLFVAVNWNQLEINSNVWLFFVAILLQFILLMGLGLLLAPMMVLLKDIEPLVRLALRFLFYASPIIYGVHDIATRLPEWLHNVFFLNPMSGILSSYRAGFFASEVNFRAVGIAAALSVLTFVIGWWVFARAEKTVLKEM